MAFFEEIGKHLTGAGQNIAQQTKSIADVTKLNSAISEKEKKISQLLLLIGQSYYEKHKNDDNAEELDKIAEIKALYSEIFTYREKIKQIKGVVKCKNCGADVPLTASFCNSCGAKVNSVETNSVNTDTECLCPACHAIVEKGNLFCTHCGAKIENTNVNSVETASVDTAAECLCSVCHAIVEKDNLFCTHCGAKIENTNE